MTPRVVIREHPSFRREIVRGPEAEHAVRETGERVAQRARQIFFSTDPDAPIEVVVHEDRRGKVAGVVNKDFKGHFFEGGTVKMPARPYLRPSLDAERLPPAPADDGAQ